MIYTTMKCECCGKEFISLYWEDGYIAHVTNFVGNKDVFAQRCDLIDMAREIVFDGNNVRPQNVIRDLLKCFMTWDCFSEDFKQCVKKIVDAVILDVENAKKEAERLEKSISPLVIAILREEDIDDAYYYLFDRCCAEVAE